MLSGRSASAGTRLPGSDALRPRRPKFAGRRGSIALAAVLLSSAAGAPAGREAAPDAAFTSVTAAVVRHRVAFAGTPVPAAVEEDHARLVETVTPLLEWAEGEKLYVPRPPGTVSFKRGARDGVRFGVAVTRLDLDSYPAWQILGFDLIAVDPVIGSDGRLDLDGLAGLVNG